MIDEVTYILLKLGKKSVNEIARDLLMLEVLPHDKEICKIGFEFIKTFHLKIHDALILATCKYYQIPNLVSLDEHFVIPCQVENIRLINS